MMDEESKKIIIKMNELLNARDALKAKMKSNESDNMRMSVVCSTLLDEYQVLRHKLNESLAKKPEGDQD